MRQRFYILLLALLALPGCGKTLSHPLGGGYFIEGEKNNGWLMEPGGGSTNRRLIYRKGDKEVELSRHLAHVENPGGSGSFEYRVFGDNLVYVEEALEDRGRPYAKYLRVYSPKSGNITIIEDLIAYVEIAANDEGIKCYRAPDPKPANDPNPKFFSADQLKNL